MTSGQPADDLACCADTVRPVSNATAAPPTRTTAPSRAPGPPLGNNGFAQGAVWFGVFGLFPLGLICGAVALFQVWRSGQRGRGLAILGIILSTVWGLVLVNAFATTQGPSRLPGGGVSHAQYDAMVDVRTGDCFLWPGRDLSVDASVQLVPCSRPHEAQVYGTSSLQGWTDFTADGAAGREAQRRCAIAAVGYAASGGLEAEVVYPDTVGWAAASRQVFCLFLTRNGLTTSVVRAA